jgi:hypothetical protein
MSQYPGYPGPAPVAWTPPATKKRPKALWWVGGVLMVLALAVFVPLLVSVIHSIVGMTDDVRDTKNPADGELHTVTVVAGGDAFLVTNGDPRGCHVRDHLTRRPIALDESWADDSESGWQLAARFPTGSGVLDVACTSPGARWAVLAVPSLGGLVARVVLLVLVPGLLGLTGLVLLVVALVLTLKRPRQPSWTGPGTY